MNKSIVCKNFIKSYVVLFVITFMLYITSQDKSLIFNQPKYILVAIGISIIASSILFFYITISRFLINSLIFSLDYNIGWQRTISDSLYGIIIILLMNMQRSFGNMPISDLIFIIVLLIPIFYLCLLSYQKREDLKQKSKMKIALWGSLTLIHYYTFLVVPAMIAALGANIFVKAANIFS